MNDFELRRRVAWLIGIRAVIVTLLLSGATSVQMSLPGSFPVDPFFLLIALTYGVTVVYALTLRFVDRHRGMIDVQVAVDAMIVTAFIYLTGGISSFFSSLYGLPIIAASVIQFRRGGLLAATLSAVMYIGLVLAQYQTAGVIHTWFFDANGTPLPRASLAQFTVALNVSGFFAIAVLSGSLAERVRTAGVSLERASTQIVNLQAFNQDIINSLPSGLITTDMAQRILTFNSAAEAITGAAAEKALGRPIAEVLQLPVSLVAALDGGLEGGGVRRVNIRFKMSDGRDRDIGLSAAHLETLGGRAGFLFTFQDLTEIRKLEREVLLKQRLAAVGEMAAGIAHEIRNPLASMSGSIQILRQELALTPEQDQLMDIVLRESERLNSTIRSFLAYARPQRFAIARFDLRRALRDTALLIRNSAEVGQGHAIEVDTPADELWYEADEGQIRQILWNLATNGLRAMPDGGRLRLIAKADAAAQAVVVAVEDEGTGMTTEEIEGLFQPFHGTFAKGSGLGLAIVHRIVTDYHGEIQVTSQPGAGTLVSIRLPAAVEVTI